MRFRYLLAILLFTLPQLLVGQEKMVAFLDAFNNNISAKKFYNPKLQDRFVRVKYERGDTIINKLIFREEEGNIDEDGMQILRSYLASCTGKFISLDEVIVIQYFGGTESQTSSAFYSVSPGYYPGLQETLGQALDEMGENRLILLYKTMEGMRQERQLLPWESDFEEAVHELFFAYPGLGDSFAIVGPKGNYYVFLGEYPIEMIEEKAPEFFGLKKKKKKSKRK